MNSSDGKIPIFEPFNLYRIRCAIADRYDKPHKPKHLPITSKAWRVLKAILEVDPHFVPASEAAIWERSERMGL